MLVFKSKSYKGCLRVQWPRPEPRTVERGVNTSSVGGSGSRRSGVLCPESIWNRKRALGEKLWPRAQVCQRSCAFLQHALL